MYTDKLVRIDKRKLNKAQRAEYWECVNAIVRHRNDGYKNKVVEMLQEHCEYWESLDGQTEGDIT